VSQTKARVNTRLGFLKEDAVDNRVALATEGLQPYFEKMLREKYF
jgi:hypothetical protein